MQNTERVAEVLDAYFDSVRKDGYIVDGVTGAEAAGVIEAASRGVEASLHDTGPGGICEDCGHFACRHDGAECHFPRPADNPCTCGGMLWQGRRLEMNAQTGPAQTPNL